MEKEQRHPLLGLQVAGVRVVPLSLKIISIFLLLLLVSNFASNYLNLLLNRAEQVRLLKELLRKDLIDVNRIANNLFDVYQFNNRSPESRASAIDSLARSAQTNHAAERSVTFGVHPDGALLFQASQTPMRGGFPDRDALQTIVELHRADMLNGRIDFRINNQRYFGLYRYNSDWDAYIVRAEEYNEFYADSVRNFLLVMGFMVLVTAGCVAVGIFALRRVLRFVSILTQSIMGMQEKQELAMIDIGDAPNDEITYLGVAFNTLSDTVRNLMDIFRKFVTRDIVKQAYTERSVRLEGARRELTILFSDIRNFTTMTEVLGTDIIRLLNLHYDRSIRIIHAEKGDIGSLIGDSLLALFGTIEDEEPDYNKSLRAIVAGYNILENTKLLRQEMHKRREEIMRIRGALTKEEEIIYRAVLLQIGVGIDGGPVFYGNIGSYERMVNTVIGDNVNAASRLEGLTKQYKVPMICSDYVRRDAEGSTGDYYFMEIDRVRVKGKQTGTCIFWPMPRADIDADMQTDIDRFRQALQLYYQGSWQEALDDFRRCTLPVATLFINRIADMRVPADWNGIWTMTEK